MKHLLSIPTIIISQLQAIADNKESIGFAAVLTALVEFYLKSWQIDVFLFLLLSGLIALNTWSGVWKARKAKEYDDAIFREKLISKSIGYFILLLALSLLTGVLFLASLMDEKQWISNWWLNIPMVLLFVALSTLEFKSTIDNLERAGVNVPFFIKKLPDQIDDKIEKITGTDK